MHYHGGLFHVQVQSQQFQETAVGWHWLLNTVAHSHRAVDRATEEERYLTGGGGRGGEGRGGEGGEGRGGEGRGGEGRGGEGRGGEKR